MIYIAFLPPQGAMTHAEESAQAKRLLSYFYKTVFSKEPPEIKKTPEGKPFFISPDSPQFSISHSKGAAAVVICDEQLSVGVDIETKINTEKIERLCKRFPFIKKRSADRISGGISFFYAVPTLCGFDFKATKKDTSSVSEATFFWTEAEALSKAGGAGLAGSKALDNLEASHEISSFVFDDFYLSIAKKKDICE